MNYSIRHIAGPSSDPLTIAQAKVHLQVDSTVEDAYIAAMISAARRSIENELGKPIGPQTFEMALEGWPYFGMSYTSKYGGVIRIPRPPLISVNSITYKSYSPVSIVTLPGSVYDVDTSSEPGMVFLKPGQSWPYVTLYPGNPILINLTAGISPVSELIIQMMHLMIGHFYRNRESVTIGALEQGTEMPLGMRYLLMPERYDPFHLEDV